VSARPSALHNTSRSIDGLSTAIHATVDRAIDEQRLVGAVILVSRDGQLVHQSATGFADRETASPMRESALFRLASVSKTIVSTALVVLAGQGLLGIDDPVTRWLPEFRPRLPDGSTPQITIRQLLTHTAGLSYRFLETDDNGPYARAGVSDGLDRAGISLAENLRRIASVPLSYAPGTAWGYSVAIDVLGALIEAVCQTPLDQAIRNLVTAPLGMHDTAFNVIDATRLAAVYVNDTSAPHRMSAFEIVPAFEGTIGIRFEPKRAFDTSAFASGGAGMVGSAADLLRLLETLRQGGAPLLPSELASEMGRNQTGEFGPPDAPGFGFGLGFSVLHDPATARSPESPGTWRWGGAYGHSWFVDTARALSVIALTNTLYEGMSGRFVGELRDAIYGAIDTGASR
jgi:CubicO group peptidase (beta-lactamase class C family)